MKVAVAVIPDAQGRFLITKRSAERSHAGFWEFPGGKCEPGESPESALKREILEEVGLVLIESSFLAQIDHRYPNHAVSLFVFLVKQYQGEAECREDQADLRWVSLKELERFEFPKANEKIIELIEIAIKKLSFSTDEGGSK